MKSIWLNLLNTGLLAEKQYEENRKIRLQNQVSLLISVLGFFFIVINLFSRKILLALTEVVVIAILGVCIYLNSRHKYLLSSTLFYASIGLMLMLFCFLFSPKRDLEYLLLLFGVLPLLFCERKSTIQYLFTISFLAFLAAKIFAYGVQDIVMYLNYSFIFFLAFFTIRYLIDEFEGYRKVIESQNLQLKKLNNENSQLISIASHDLRSPLARVQGMLSLLSMKTDLGTEQNELLILMEREVKDQIDMISEVLNLGAITEDGNRIRLERVDALAMINNLMTSFQPIAKRKGISFLMECKDGQHYCMANPNYLKKVVENLISNAVKFSFSNTRITISLWNTTHSLHMSFRDEGPGMDKDDMSKLYLRFQQLSAKPTGGEDSSGLGLSIVKKYVEGMNGVLHCLSEKGKGTTFIVEMPIGLDPRG
jgi:signal transduction histidine kinase